MNGLKRFREKLFTRIEVIEEDSLPNVDSENTLKIVKFPSFSPSLKLVEKTRILQFHFSSAEEKEVILQELNRLKEEENAKVILEIEPGTIYCQALTKGDVISFLSHYKNSSEPFIIAMGDSLNDLSMLRISDLPCCPANSLSEVKEIVKKKKGIIAEKNGVEAVGEVIQRILTKFYNAEHFSPSGKK